MGAGALWNKPTAVPTVGSIKKDYIFKRNPNPTNPPLGPLAGSTYQSASPHLDNPYYKDPQGRWWERPSSAPIGKYGDNTGIWSKTGDVTKPNYFDLDQSGDRYTEDDIAALQLEYDTDEALRQDKLDKMSQLAQGQGGGGGGISGRIVGDGGDLNIQHTAMNRGKDGFPTLADFEQPLHPFMGKRKLNLKGYA